MTRDFHSLPLNSSTLQLIEEEHGNSLLRIFDGGAETFNENGNWFGFAIDGQVTIKNSTGSFSLKQGMYFSSDREITLSGEAKVLLICRMNWQGMFSVGGPIEASGRLKYIDGCSDTLLIPPIIKGDACLNYLYFPSDIEQTLHTHPSVRIGVVYEGEGICRSNDKNIPLKKGSLFIIPAETEHAFSTEKSFMKVIAYHPDSDCGPTHENHPMINKTIVNGKSARYLDDIRTVEL